MILVIMLLMELFGRFKDLADKKKEIFEEDLIALAGGSISII